jgi:hypothetical protein
MEHAAAYWLRHYATSRKVAGSRPDEVNEFSSIYLILMSALGPGIYLTSNRNSARNKKIMFLKSRARPVRRADSFNPICEPIIYIYTMCDPQHLTVV